MDFWQNTKLLKYLVAASLGISGGIPRKQTINQSLLLIMVLAPRGLEKKRVDANIFISADYCVCKCCILENPAESRVGLGFRWNE